MQTNTRQSYTAAIVLGMHDAIVSLVGLIAGLIFTIPSRAEIILTAIIASVVAALSMCAANYLSVRVHEYDTMDANLHPVTSAIATFIAYMMTCIILIIPILLFENRHIALGATFAVAVLIIFGFNLYAAHRQGGRFWHRFIEMLIICTVVSVVAFMIGRVAKNFFGIGI